MMARPSPYMMAPAHRTRTVPKRSAIAPAKGCPTPHNRFWMANAIENTSRPQPLANDRGVRNWPAAERGPKVSKPIRQPHRTITAGGGHGSILYASGFAAAVLVGDLPPPRPHRACIGTAQPNRGQSAHPRNAWQRRMAADRLRGAGRDRAEVLYMICSN